ncbi:dynein regulatory complex protein 1 [Sphaeramia orbicularis]|uniref:dynein regulatory complex protein 1 n=1 Tax=Sphaeramia orbicularis TaxID=375764 RepID=UPI00117C2C19|nr:dynein regulatory complex protein 1 [Sphaeramia orbicularis]
MRRSKLEEDRRNRLERLENNVKSSKEKFEEITKGWETANLKVVPQELQKAVNSQQQLCAVVIGEKKKLISDLKQELKLSDEYYVKDLRKQAEEIDLMIERMEDQIQTLIKAYREELAEIENVYQQEHEALLTSDKTVWERCMKELLDKNVERLTYRMQKVEEYEATIHNLMFEVSDIHYAIKMEEDAKFQALEVEAQQIQGESLFLKERIKKEQIYQHALNINFTQTKNRLSSLQDELKTLISRGKIQQPQLDKKREKLYQDYKRSFQQYKHMQMKIKNFAVADAQKFEKMWITLEEEVKQLQERALVIDSMIHKHILDVPWEQPSLPSTEPQKQTKMEAVSQASPYTDDLNHRHDTSAGSKSGTSTDMEMYRVGTTVQSESGAEVTREQSRAEGDRKVSANTMKKLMELMYDEMGFFKEDNIVKLLGPQRKDGQTFVKIESLLLALGIDEDDMYKLVDFVLKYKQQENEQSEFQKDEADELEASSTTKLPHDFIHPNDALPALKCFVEKQMQHRESLAAESAKVRDVSKDAAYWESMGNIISADKRQIWEMAEIILRQYIPVLTDISEILPEVQSLEQQNTELRMLLQKSLNTRVSTELEIP